jgi:S-formylglutathione hydrolase FrmB
MGGYGAIKLAMKHPEIYNAVYATSAAFLGFAGDLGVQNSAWRTALNLKEMNQFSGADFWVQVLIAVSAAFSPNPNRPPFFVDFPFELVGGTLKPAEPAHSKWLAQMPLTMPDKYKLNLSRFRGTGFDIGKSDAFTHIPLTNRSFSQALTNLGIPHLFEEHANGHIHVLVQYTTKVLPFFSDTLAFEMLQVVTNVQPHGKLATTWGTIKGGK